MQISSFLPQTAPPSTHAWFNTFAFYPSDLGAKYYFIALDNNVSASSQSWASAKFRILCVAQAIASAVLLVFELLFAMALNAYLAHSRDYAHYGASTFYAAISATAHAVAIPLSLFFACLPLNVISNIRQDMQRLEPEIHQRWERGFTNYQ